MTSMIGHGVLTMSFPVVNIQGWSGFSKLLVNLNTFYNIKHLIKLEDRFWDSFLSKL
jgi:hypothetical protein